MNILIVESFREEMNRHRIVLDIPDEALLALKMPLRFGVKSLFLILLQNPPSQNREDLSKTVSGAVGIGNNPKIVS